MGKTPALYRFKPKDITADVSVRRIWCGKCNTCLAEEVSSCMTKTAFEWRSRPYGIWIRGRWWGNKYRCFVCGTEGTFPIDKPVSLVEEKNETRSQTPDNQTGSSQEGDGVLERTV